MGQKKLVRFSEIESFPNVLQYPPDIKGNWHKFFKNENEIILELACGKGEYAIGLAKLYPKKNFIGVDLKGNRIWVGAKKALAEKLNNVAFLRTQIDMIDSYFGQKEVSEIWITFPDPQLRLSKIKKRLTHPKFLRKYQQFLLPGAYLHLKTDSPDLYYFTNQVIEMYGCNQIAAIENIHDNPDVLAELKIKTHYESLDIAQSKKVHYLCFTLPELLPGTDKDVELKEKLKEYEGTN